MRANEHQEGPEFYLVQYGLEGALGSFRAADGLRPRRGEKVVLQGERGLEAGTILGPASVRQSRLLGNAGQIARRWGAAEDALFLRARGQAEIMFRAARSLAGELQLGVEILDVDLALDGSRALLLLLSPPGEDPEPLLLGLRNAFGVAVQYHNLAGEKMAEAHPEEEEGGCGKEGCGKEGGGCSTCGSGGGCGSGCGSGGVDLREYFGQLRGRMEKTGRVPLI